MLIRSCYFIKRTVFLGKLTKIFDCVLQIIWGTKHVVNLGYIRHCCPADFFCGNEYIINFSLYLC